VHERRLARSVGADHQAAPAIVVTHASTFRLEVATSPELVAIARTLMTEYAALPHTSGRWTTAAADIAALPVPYVSPSGVLLVAVGSGSDGHIDDASALGCGGLVALSTPGDAEIKRVYVRPSARGRGIGEAITVELMRMAETLGFTRIRLDTAPELTTAIRLYERLGFTHIPPYKAGLLADAVCMERSLTLRNSDTRSGSSW
jgi:ribosomal protein S18 acetylase RimI-like enzyme